MSTEESKGLKLLRVPELREKLLAVGLAATGTKPELIQRLTDHFASLDSSQKVKNGEIAIGQSSEVVDMRIAVGSSAEHSSLNEVVAEVERGASYTVDNAANLASSIDKSLTEQEKIALRVSRFGGVALESEKKKQRASRFGGDVKESSDELEQKRLERQKRFENEKTPAEKAEEELRKKRASKFGAETLVIDSDIAKKRQEKFADTNLAEFVEMNKHKSFKRARKNN